MSGRCLDAATRIIGIRFKLAVTLPVQPGQFLISSSSSVLIVGVLWIGLMQCGFCLRWLTPGVCRRAVGN